MKNILSAVTLSLILCACGTPAENQPLGESSMSDEPAASFETRVAGAKERLTKSEGGQLVWDAMEAHGGLETWYENSPLYFRFNYQPTDGKGSARDSYILNDYVNARSVHQVAGDKDLTYGFDGQDAWKNPADSDPGISPRFWSLTPYYFVGLPFVLGDEGINFEMMEKEELDGQTYHKVRVTYKEGTGDADQDYYVLYLNPDTRELDALNYIVSYRGFFDKGEHLPEKLMRITGKTFVNGIKLPTGYGTSWSEEPDVNITDITVSDYEFRPDTDEAAFAKPATAAVVNDLPGE